MGSAKQFLIRFWSLIAAVLVSYLTFRADPFADSISGETPNAVVWVWSLCALALGGTCMNIILLEHSWKIQRTHAKGKWQRVFWAHLLILPLLVVVVRGLHNIQIATYDFSIEHDRFQMLNFRAGQVKDVLIWLLPLDVFLIVIWGIVALINSIGSKATIHDL
ncbi:MAG: hypothetical protein P4K93_05995 [Terracidiphilus sp.]|nr:hypothetical protein [Terracidiphilus sp.]MDR3797682.1 hypothetical protein [Terracidiphilus sp.]